MLGSHHGSPHPAVGTCPPHAPAPPPLRPPVPCPYFHPLPPPPASRAGRGQHSTRRSTTARQVAAAAQATQQRGGTLPEFDEDGTPLSYMWYQELSDGSDRPIVRMPVPDYSKKLDDGSHPLVYVDIPESELDAQETAAAVREFDRAHAEYASVQPLLDLDLHRLDVQMPRAPPPPPGLHSLTRGVEAVQGPAVGAVRAITDIRELDLVGKGLPIITGGEWPAAMWGPLQSLDRGEGVTVPRPHPKLDADDITRIAAEGPRFADLVLEHIERKGPEAAVAVTYIPATVMGDWLSDVEPNWSQMPRMSVPEFWAGLRARNWTAGKHYQPTVFPWRIQFFRCGNTGPTAWPGLRAAVTVMPPHDAQVLKWAQGSRGPQGLPAHVIYRAPPGTLFWVDMPEPGLGGGGGQQTLQCPGGAGSDAVLAQVYQAFEQRLSAAARQELVVQGYLTPGRHPYSCPSEPLLDVSWHVTSPSATHPLTRFLINPNPVDAVAWLKKGVDESGLYELKRFRDFVMFQVGPEPLQLDWLTFDPNNAGPLYFLVCLTLGIVIPALRRNRILDIKTLEEDPGAAMEFARSKASARKEGLTGVEFKDVAGIGPVMNEVLEVVEFLKDPKAFSMLGARPPKGLLLEGDPGTGKTLLTKALAGEAMVPFYQMAGTEFTEGIVGVGAARVRDLFKRARANAPCVVFVDEIDALGLKRAQGDGSGKVNEEREQTLNQLLTEMDGFTPDTGVVFIGATNRADLLDPALLRPGRFDRKIRMPKPDTEGRYEILQLHLRNKKLATDVDLMQVSRDLPGLVGADLANIVNEAQLCAVRAGRDTITTRDMYAGVDRFTQGEKRAPLPTTHKLPVTVFASKEVGIALVAETLRSRYGRIEPVERISIQPKGRSISRTLFARGTDEDYQIMTRGRLLDRIRVALAGHVAVRCVLGQETNFSMPDIKRACSMANKLVFYYGMSELGITTWAQKPYSSDFAIGSTRPRKVVSTDAMDEFADWPTVNEDFRFGPYDPSDVTWHRYTDQVRKVIKECYSDVWEILQQRRDALWAGVAALAEQGEMLGPDVRTVFDAHPPTATPPDIPMPLEDMIIFTDKAKGGDKWPYNMEWLPDAYPVPYWVKQQQELDKARQKQEPEMAAAQ